MSAALISASSCQPAKIPAAICCFSRLFRTRNRRYAAVPGRTTGEGSICSFAAWRGSRGAGIHVRGRVRTDGAQLFALLPLFFICLPALWLFFLLTCVAVQMSLHTHTHTHTYCISQFPRLFWQANKDPLFLTGVTFPSEYPAGPEMLVKMTVFDAKDKTQEPVSTELLCHVHVKSC